MKLAIKTDCETADGLKEDTYIIPVAWLSSNATHLYLASNTWDSLYIELTAQVPKGFLPYLLKKVSGEITCIIKEDSKVVLDLLVELYPEKAPEFRKQFLCHKPLEEVLHAMC